MIIYNVGAVNGLSKSVRNPLQLPYIDVSSCTCAIRMGQLTAKILPPEREFQLLMLKMLRPCGKGRHPTV